MVPGERIELPTRSSSGSCSTTELPRQKTKRYLYCTVSYVFVNAHMRNGTPMHLYNRALFYDTTNRGIHINKDLFMKKDIHPALHEITATCTCGALFTTRSTSAHVKATLCSQCHPFFTGKQKFVDAAGRIDKFEKKFGKKTFKKGS
jgi:large subunit ribosomal protein L31